MNMKHDSEHKGTEQMHFDQGWWDFILSNEPSEQSEEMGSMMPDKTAHNPKDGNDWDYIEQLYQKDVIIQVTIIGYNKGGLLAKTDRLQGFIPVSHIYLEDQMEMISNQGEAFKDRVGQISNVKVIECNQALNKVVLSERAAQTEDGKRKELISSLVPNTIVEGKVTNITNFGVFVDLGGVEGLVHISELSWGRVRRPEDHAKLGEKISVLILSVDTREMHVALSLKRLNPNPWFELERRYQPGDVVSGKVSKILPYGAFVRLDEGVEGLIHISTLEMNDKINDLNNVFSVGQEVFVEILHIDSRKHRLGLALAKTEK
ncbi:MAG: small subunit ribosomal protein [Chloroflexota bacterium]|nr:small subunit ribosomal protein [Chloroflexota bacterium]